MTSARDVYQDHLDRVSEYLWREEYDAVCGELQFPKRVETADTVAIMENAAAMRVSLIAFRASMQRLGAHGYHRVCIDAEVSEDDPAMIEGRHRTYIMRSGQYAVDPYVAHMRLRRVGDRWLGSDISSALLNRDCTVVRSGTPTDDAASRRPASTQSARAASDHPSRRPSADSRK